MSKTPLTLRQIIHALEKASPDAFFWRDSQIVASRFDAHDVAFLGGSQKIPASEAVRWLKSLEGAPMEYCKGGTFYVSLDRWVWSQWDDDQVGEVVVGVREIRNLCSDEPPLVHLDVLTPSEVRLE